MKKVHFIIGLVLVSTLLSCSNDDTSGPDNSSNFSTPLTVGSYWTYDVEGQAGITRDSLFIDSEFSELISPLRHFISERQFLFFTHMSYIS